jgi:hypothetical protein
MKTKTGYYICEICEKPVKATLYDKHLEEHGERRITSKVDLGKLERILNEAKEAYERKGRNALFLFFEIARRAFAETEKVDTSSWSYIFDYEIPEIISQVRVRVPSKYPPIMCHIKFKVKDKRLFDKLCKKYKGTEKETILKTMVTKNIPVIVVHGKNWGKQVLEWKAEGLSSADIQMLTVFFFLHEMYHILGFGEKDATTKASKIMSQMFGQRMLIPEHEIERWRFEEKLKKV